jgi:hypothetical protein
MKKLLLSITLLSLASCQRGCQSMDRSIQTGKLGYNIKVYSGGKIVFEDTFIGIVNNSESSNGIYYYKNDSLVEISGDYILKAN